MVIWHFLNKTRLLEKIAYSKAHDGKLLLHPPEISKDISKGALHSYLYCLPNILSGMNFGDTAELALIKIELKKSPRLFQFRGNPRSIDYAQVARDFDLLDMTVDSDEFSAIRFRQILLLNSQVIENWSHSLNTDVAPEFELAFQEMSSGNFKAEDFFMVDFDHKEMITAAQINAHLLGIRIMNATELDQKQKILNEAMRRLGALG